MIDSVKQRTLFKPMKILCVWHDEEPEFLATNPVEEFDGHEVICAHHYDEAVRLMKAASEQDTPFDIVLSDTFLPGNTIEPVWSYGPLLVMHADRYSVRGLGLLLIPELQEVCVHEDEAKQDIFVASNTCWTPAGKRDWQKLLRIVLFRLKRVGIELH